MKSLFGFLFFLSVMHISCTTAGSMEDKTQYIKLPKELSSLPNGIEVSHSKDTVYAELNEKDPEKRGKYKWHYETTVNSINEDLIITEFGAYLLVNGNWEQKTIYDRPFNNEEFSKWYSCPNGELEKSVEYTDFNNWSKGGKLDSKAQEVLWYYIGVNNEGEKFKGIAKIISIHKFQ